MGLWATQEYSRYAYQWAGKPDHSFRLATEAEKQLMGGGEHIKMSKDNISTPPSTETWHVSM